MRRIIVICAVAGFVAALAMLHSHAALEAEPTNAEKLEQQVSHNISESGNEFLEKCKRVEDEYDSRYSSDVFICLGFVQGFMQGIFVSDDFRHSPEEQRMTCPSPEVTTIQLIRVIKKHIDEQPKRAHLPTRYLASEALIKAFPCKK